MKWCKSLEIFVVEYLFSLTTMWSIHNQLRLNNIQYCPKSSFVLCSHVVYAINGIHCCKFFVNFFLIIINYSKQRTMSIIRQPKLFILFISDVVTKKDGTTTYLYQTKYVYILAWNRKNIHATTLRSIHVEIWTIQWK